MRHAIAVISAAVLTAAGVAGPACSADPDLPTGSTRSASSEAQATTTRAAEVDTVGARGSSADDAVDYVVAVSVDGLNPDAIRRLGRQGAPAFHRLIDEGATTLNARTAVELTRTLPNHTGMVTGRPVTRGREHGVTFNHDNRSTVHRSAGEHVASIFTVVHNRGGSTALYTAKRKFDFLDRSWNGRHGSPDRHGANQGRDKIDRYVVDRGGDNVTRLVRRLRSSPDELSVLHLAHPDRAGHRYGFMSARYLAAVRRTDRQVGRVLEAIDDLRRLRRHTVVVLTADHGGLGAGHSDPRAPSHYTVPFMVWGVGVARGADLYRLNTGVRQDPGSGRPGYQAMPQPVRNGELANLVADLLDMPAVPGSTFNRGRGLQVS
jgi:hypothetical protein